MRSRAPIAPDGPPVARPRARPAAVAAACLTAALAAPAAAGDAASLGREDPFRTGILEHRVAELLGADARASFDPRVVVVAPAVAEDSLHVPALVDARAVGDVARIVVFVDYGPIPHILDFHPGAGEARFAFRFKVDQATPLRAAVQTADGGWVLGGSEVDAAGGGCSAAPAAYAADDWEERLGDVQARVWPAAGRVGVIVDHPMDTGLSGGVPRFHIERLTLADAGGVELARVELREPVSEDPSFTFFADPARLTGPLRLSGRDNQGNEIDAAIPVPGPTR
jgi:sulfur-oxidizing protein SoxY